MDKFNDVDKANQYVCPPFKHNCVEPNYDASMEFFVGIIYSVVPCAFFWIGIYHLIQWL